MSPSGTMTVCSFFLLQDAEILFFVSDATFGIQQEVYYVEENAGFVRVCAELFDGCLQRDVYIECKKLDATAMSEYNIHYKQIQSCFLCNV